MTMRGQALAPCSPNLGTPRGAVVVAEQVSLWYGERPALSDVCLRIEGNAVTSIVGPSGSGKSSFLMCLNRLTDLVPTTRVSGNVRLGELEVFGRRTDVVALRRRVGMIFQRPTPFPTSIMRNLTIPLTEHGLRNRSELCCVMEQSLKDVALWDDVKDRLDAPASNLSGGQQQRLCIARALVLKPDVLLMDEPCSALDPMSTGAIEELISRLSERQAIVIVTHNLSQARRVADSVALFWAGAKGGRLIEHRRRDEFFEDPSHELTRAYTKLGGEV
jgi:phosphate transport system ATP-binding protein